jgi:PAS domain S-box-containing protein
MPDTDITRRMIQIALRALAATDGLVVWYAADGRIDHSHQQPGDGRDAGAAQADGDAIRALASAIAGIPRATVLPALEADLPTAARVADVLGPLGASSMLVTPLAPTATATRGVLAIWDRRPGRAWRPADIDLVREIAVVLSATFAVRESVRATSGASAWPRHSLAAERKSRLSEVLAAPGSSRSMLVAAAKHLQETLGVPSIRVWMLDRAGSFLRLDGVWEGDSRLERKPARVPVGEQRIGQIAATQQPRVIDDISQDPGRDPTEWPEPEGLRAFAGFPLVIDGRILGVLATAAATPFKEESLDMLRSAADDVTAAVIRKKAEEHVRSSEVRKAAILQSALDAIITIDHEGRVLEFNPAAEAMFGYTLGEVFNRSLADLIVPPPMRDAHRRGMAHYLATGEGPVLGKRIEIEAQHADGTIFPVELAITVVPQEGATLFTAYLRDISGRRAAEALIRDREIRLQSIVETAVDGIIVIDQHGNVESFNPAAERLFGYTASEIVGQNVDVLMTAEDVPRHHDSFQQFIETGESHVIGRRREVMARRKDGEVVPMELAVSAMRIGDEWKFTGIARGLSEQRRAARELQRTNELLEAVHSIQLRYISEDDPRTLFDTMLSQVLRVSDSQFGFVGEVLVDGEGQPFMRTLALTNIAWDDATRRRYDAQYADGLEFRNLDTLFGRVMTTGRTVISNDPAHDARRGGLPPGHPPLEKFACVPLDMAGRLVGMIGLANRPEGYDDALLAELDTLFSACAGVLAGHQEFCRRRAAEESLALAKERAEAASRAKSDFLANMSHEVRTPMASVLGYADMLLEPELSPADRDQALQGVRRNGEHLMHLIDDILDLSKIEAGKLVLESVPVAPRSMLHEVLSLHRGAATERGVMLHAEINGLTPREIRTDPVRVRQVLVNLLSNAIKFTPSGGKITLRMFAERIPDAAANLVMAVEDNGIGMSDRQMEHLFQPFQQADSSTTRRYGGSGLGLSISKRIVDALGGTISVESRVGAGSTFTVRLPIGAESAAQPWEHGQPVGWDSLTRSPGSNRPAASSIHGTVLVAEDSPDIQRIVARLLKSAGLDVEVAEDGLRAIEAVGRRHFDLILMDMQMPRLDGYGAASSLRRSGYGGPIVALTAHALHEDRERCLRAGCTDYLAKPVDRQTLLDCVRRYVHVPVRNGGAAEVRPAAAAEPADPSLAELKRGYVESLRRTLAAVEHAIATDDRQSMRTLAHQTRGVAGMYGYDDLTDTAGLLEDAIREEEDRELIQELADEFVRGIQAILQAP